MMRKKNAYNVILIGKPEGKRPLGRPKRGVWILLKWVDSEGF
jgi:hypothetical protein